MWWKFALRVIYCWSVLESLVQPALRINEVSYLELFFNHYWT